jgi:hypothetical protein
MLLAFAASGSSAFAPVAAMADSGPASELVIRLPAPDAAPAAQASAPLPAAAGVATARLLLQPDAPRAPVVQPAPLPAPAETIPPGEGNNPTVPAPTYGKLGLPPIGSLTINILPSAGQVPREVDSSQIMEHEFGPTEFRREPINYSYFWTAPAFFHRPLYFEQPNLERYGYDWGLAQPFISGAQFFVKIPLLPYMMSVHCPNEPVYSLGYYRPGSRVPYQINWPEVRLDAAIIEATFITGLVFLIP